MAEAAQPRQAARDGGDDGDPSRELHALQQLQAMRADALAWLAEIERRIATIEAQQAAASVPASVPAIVVRA